MVQIAQIIDMQEDEFLVSKTDTNNKIIYANQAFCRSSGYAETELLGESHNIMKHPDMPAGIYNLLWEHLASEQEFFGYIKYATKQGSGYWTFANITPFYEGDKLAGYFSVRRAPEQKALPFIEDLYKKMRLAEEQASEEQKLCVSSSVLWQAITKEYQTYAQFVLSL